MTVAELISELRTLPQHLQVVVWDDWYGGELAAIRSVEYESGDLHVELVNELMESAKR